MNKNNSFQNERYLVFDESGNLGSSGRYFVIACIDTSNYKELHNVMKRKLGIAKQKFPELAALHTHEIKAKETYPCVKYHLLEVIARKELSIHYIVADLYHIRPRLLEDKNILYNYLTRLLIDHLVSDSDNGKKLNLICDNHTTKIASGNSFEEYIKIHLLYDRNLDLDISVIYMDSNDRNAYPVQAADYVANAIYSYYEYNNDLYFQRLTNRLSSQVQFPYKSFGK